MTTLLNPPSRIVTLADLLERLGGVSPDRVRFRPMPGTATEQDVIDIDVKENRHYELIDGVLVEVDVGLRESLLAAAIMSALRAFVMPRRLGIISGEGGTLRLLPGLVRIPDVAFISSAKLPGGRVPTEPVPLLIPDLAIEILSAGNTETEMARKLREYFEVGVRLVWYVDPECRTVSVYTSPDAVTVLTEDQTLGGGDVLPGFEMPIRQPFAELDQLYGRPT